MISDVLPASTKAIAITALYFSALWERTFMEGATKSYVSSLIFKIYWKFSSKKNIWKLTKIIHTQKRVVSRWTWPTFNHGRYDGNWRIISILRFKRVRLPYHWSSISQAFNHHVYHNAKQFNASSPETIPSLTHSW